MKVFELFSLPCITPDTILSVKRHDINGNFERLFRGDCQDFGAIKYLNCHVCYFRYSEYSDKLSITIT